jgi:hypothetical protein
MPPVLFRESRHGASDLNTTEPGAHFDEKLIRGQGTAKLGDEYLLNISGKTWYIAIPD